MAEEILVTAMDIKPMEDVKDMILVINLEEKVTGKMRTAGEDILSAEMGLLQECVPLEETKTAMVMLTKSFAILL